MLGALLLFTDGEFINIVSISFTALIFTELLMVALTIHTWHWTMVMAQLLSLVIYILSMFVLTDYFGMCCGYTDCSARNTFLYKEVPWRPCLIRHCFVVTDLRFVRSSEFVWKTLVITVVSCLPLYILKFLKHRLAPPSYAKLT